MKIVYLSSTVPDAIWMRRYYSSIFPQGERNAFRQLKAAEQLILGNNAAGRRFDDVREIPILRTPFSLVYRINGDIIEVLRIWDQRRNPADLKL